MTSSTSGTTSFNMDVDSIVDMAMKPLGGDPLSGQQAADARISLNLILLELQNKNIPLNKLGTSSISAVANTSTYTLASDVVDIQDAYYRHDTTTADIKLNRFSHNQYQSIYDKTETGEPAGYSIVRGTNTTTLTLWPVPEENCTIFLSVFKKVEDVTAAYQKIDLQPKYLPLIVKWLRYEIATNAQNVDINKLSLWKNEYKEAMDDVFGEDRERVDLMIKPGGLRGR